MCVGLSVDIFNFNDWLVLDVVGWFVFFMWDKVGNLSGFLNVCCYCGVLVVEGCGNVNWFMCFYYGWIYSNSGELIV